MKKGNESLTRNLLTLCLSLFVLTALSVTVAEAFLVAAQEKDNSAKESDSLAATFVPPLAQALWDYNDSQLDLLVNTLAAVPSMGRITIRGLDGQTLQRSVPASLGQPRVYPMVYNHLGRTQTLGSLILEPSMTEVDKRVLSTIWIGALRTGILVGLLSLILIVVAGRLIGRPLRRLATQVSQLEPDGSGQRFLVSDPRSGLELAQVTQAFNHLVKQLRGTIEDLNSQRAQLRTLLDTVPDLIWLKDPEGIYLACNRRFEGFFGARQHEIQGKTDFDFVDAALASFFRANDMAAMAAGKPTKNEEEIVFANDGHRELLETIKTPVYGSDGTVLGVLGIGRDITERKQAEEEKERLRARLQQSQKLESLGNLASGLAHEMNNVLAVILSMASAHLAAAEPGTKVHHAFDTIGRAADRGGKLVKSLLSFARQSPVEDRTIRLTDLLQEEAALFERLAASTVALAWDLEPRLGLVQGDPSALVSALLNLCANAVDAMPDGGRLVIRTRNSQGNVELEVEDTGSGMPPAVLKKALDPFFTTKAVGKGTGLGLALVDATVRSHHGTMEILSEVGKGTLVRLSFPAVAAQDAGPAAPAASAVVSAPLHVLLVDDDDLVREATEALLQSLGHRTTLASSGEACLTLLEGGLRADLIILDRNMPGLGGRGTLPRLRELDPEVPVLLATGQVDQSALDLIGQYSGVALLGKPYTRNELEEKLSVAKPRPPT